MKRRAAGKNRRRRIWLGVAILVLLFGVASAWQWSPLAQQIDIRKVSAWAVSLRNHPARPLIILTAYLVGTLMLVPITVLIIATAIVFGPVLGFAYSFAGCFLGAGATYALGYFLGRDFVRQITGPKWERVERKIEQSGIMAVATLRLLPVAPFTVVNVISGAFQVPVRDYILGSILGLAPGIFVINLFEHQLENAVRNPGAGSYVFLGALVVISVWGSYGCAGSLADGRGYGCDSAALSPDQDEDPCQQRQNSHEPTGNSETYKRCQAGHNKPECQQYYSNRHFDSPFFT